MSAGGLATALAAARTGKPIHLPEDTRLPTTSGIQGIRPGTPPECTSRSGCALVAICPLQVVAVDRLLTPPAPQALQAVSRAATGTGLGKFVVVFCFRLCPAPPETHPPWQRRVAPGTSRSSTPAALQRTPLPWVIVLLFRTTQHRYSLCQEDDTPGALHPRRPRSPCSLVLEA